MKKIGTAASLNEIYSEIAGYKKTLDNPHWKDKVRQQLHLMQNSGMVTKVGYGVWCISA